MKKSNIFSTLLVAGSIMLCGCGTSSTSTASGSSNNNSANGSALGDILGAVANSAMQGAASPSAKTNTSANAGAINAGSVISGIIGILTNGVASANTIVGSWKYAEPTVQFESQNLLAQAGGIVAGNAIVNKISPYYEKLGLKNGIVAITFNEDKTCSVNMNGQNIQGTYTYDSAANKVQINSQYGFSLVTAYITLSANQMALTFDSSQILTIATALGANSGNSTLSAISNIAGSYSGMKTGFLFNRQ